MEVFVKIFQYGIPFCTHTLSLSFKAGNGFNLLRTLVQPADTQQTSFCEPFFFLWRKLCFVAGFQSIRCLEWKLCWVPASGFNILIIHVGLYDVLGWLPSLKLTFFAPENGGNPNRNPLFQRSIFRCKLLVLGRVYIITAFPASCSRPKQGKICL